MHSSEGGQSSLFGASNSFGQGPKSSPNVPMFFLRNKHPSKFVGLRLRRFNFRMCPAVENNLSGAAELVGADRYFLEHSARFG